MERFEAGSTYKGRFIGDSASAICITVANRTASTVTLTNGKRLKIHQRAGREFVFPDGRYSMAPTISAERRA